MVCLRRITNIVIFTLLLSSIQPGNAARPTVFAQSTTYRVQRGDTLSAISARFGISIQEIATLNGIRNINTIRVGQTLLVSRFQNSRNPEIQAGSQESNNQNPSTRAVPATRQNRRAQQSEQTAYVGPGVSSIDVPLQPSELKKGEIQPESVSAGCSTSPGRGERIHFIRPGETLYGIARLNGVTVHAVRQRNALTSDRIRVGDCLIVPLGYAPPPVPDRRRDSEWPQTLVTPSPVPTPTLPSLPRRTMRSRG